MSVSDVTKSELTLVLKQPGRYIGDHPDRTGEKMKRALLVLLFALLTSVFGMTQTVEQCRSGANELAEVKTEADFSELSGIMTTGDELTLATNFAHCLKLFPTQLTLAQSDRLDRAVYNFNADIIGRLLAFMERHKLSGSFKDEDQAHKAKQ
jgi:hypothetical protein